MHKTESWHIEHYKGLAVIVGMFMANKSWRMRELGNLLRISPQPK